MHNKLSKKVLSGLLASAMIVTSLTAQSSLTVNAGDFSTSIDDSTVPGTGTGDKGYHGGKWSCYYKGDTYYSIRPVLINPPDSGTEDVQLGKDYYYEFVDLALYVTSSSKTDKAYIFSSGTTACGDTLGDRTLNNDGSFDFSDVLGISLDLPKQKFDVSSPEYKGFSGTLADNIRTSGSEANVVDIMNNYISYLDSHRDMLTDKGEDKLDEYIRVSLWNRDTGTFGNPKTIGFCIDVGSIVINEYDVVNYAVSYPDLNYTGIGASASYIWKTFDLAATNNSLLTWSATYTRNNRTYTSDYDGVAYFLAFDDLKAQEASYTQSLNVTLSYDGELKADTGSDSIQSSWGMVTSDKNPDIDLGNTSYTDVLDDAYKNTLTDTSIVLDNGSTLDTANENDILQKLSGKSSYEGYKLNGYDTLNIVIDASEYNLSDIENIDISSALSGITANTRVNAVSNGFGNLYNISFEGATTARSNVADKIKDINGVSFVGSYSSKTQDGTISNMADLQGASLLAGKIEGSPTDDGLSDANGTVYATISYLSKNKEVSGKEAEVYINNNADIERVKGIEKKDYYASNYVQWSIAGKEKSYTYAIAWRASDYDMVDEEALTKSILSALGETYILRGNAGVSTLSKGFKEATGVQPLGVKYMGDVTSANLLDVGSAAKDDNTLTGINVLVISVSKELPVNIKSEDLVDSNELNYVYPNLLSWKSSVNRVLPIASYSSDITYPYNVSDFNSGDLINFKGDNVHYYYEPTGLFGVCFQVTKSFDAISYPSYAYNISRALWGDSLVASSYRGLSATDSNVKNDITNNLGLSIGAVGNVSPITCGENVDDTVSAKKEDKYKFAGTIISANGDVFNENNSYTVTHALNKYTCIALATALNDKANKAGFSIQNNDNIQNKVTMVTQSADTITVYPEVAYKYYLANTSNGVLNNVNAFTVYCMGERARTMKPSSIRGIDMDYFVGALDVAKGDIVSDGAMAGSFAGSTSDGKQVIAQGTNITMKADSTVDYRLISYSLDVVDVYGGVNVRNEFSDENANYKPDEEHEAFVQDFIDNIQVNTYMTIGSKEYEMKTSNSTPRVSQSTASTYLTIEFADGKINEDAKASVINDMAAEYDISQEEATQMFESAGFEKQLQDMFESNNDSYNASKNKWYDEESVTLCIRKYITVVDLKAALVQDKIDYNVVGSTGSKVNGETIHQTADAYFTMSVSLPEDFAGYNLVNANMLFEKQKIKDTDFKVSSSTTYDFGN